MELADLSGALRHRGNWCAQVDGGGGTSLKNAIGKAGGNAIYIARSIAQEIADRVFIIPGVAIGKMI